MIDMLKAIAEENRMRIVELLSQESLCVCEIEERMKIAQNLVSHHLAILKEVGIVEDCRCGKNKYYSLNKLAIRKLARNLSKIGHQGKSLEKGFWEETKCSNKDYRGINEN